MFKVILVVFSFISLCYAELEWVFDGTLANFTAMENEGHAVERANNGCKLDLVDLGRKLIRTESFSGFNCSQSSVCIQGECVDYSRSTMTIKTMYFSHLNMSYSPFIAVTVDEANYQPLLNIPRHLKKTLNLNHVLPLINLKENSTIYMYIGNEPSPASIVIKHITFEEILKSGKLEVSETIEFHNDIAKAVIEINIKIGN